ncbi:hypothetical protein JKP88DRAFT_241098 [Tribonema minus]|uniref:Uncharacterized protein n=1 Tax=Tribonema minus TaxID=303371 RepID=A0A836CK76_9STRA|nr:hypothetical protein JKP88DRAFT_241098 [Tribonema minus]
MAQEAAIETANQDKPRFPTWPSVQGLLLPTDGTTIRPVSLDVMALGPQALELLEAGDEQCAGSLAEAAEANVRVSAMAALRGDPGAGTYGSLSVDAVADPREQLHPQVQYLRYNNNERYLCATHLEYFGDFGYLVVFYFGAETANRDIAWLLASMAPNPHLEGVFGPVVITAMQEDEQLGQPMVQYLDLPENAVTVVALAELARAIDEGGAQHL